MKADKAAVVASEPEAREVRQVGAEHVQVSVDAEGGKAALKYSIQGEKLGCCVDAPGRGDDR